jgi:hypothetical protein
MAKKKPKIIRVGDDTDSSTMEHQEMCLKFLNPAWLLKFARQFNEYAVGTTSVKMEHLIKNKNYPIGYADVIFSVVQRTKKRRDDLPWEHPLRQAEFKGIKSIKIKGNRLEWRSDETGLSSASFVGTIEKQQTFMRENGAELYRIMKRKDFLLDNLDIHCEKEDLCVDRVFDYPQIVEVKSYIADMGAAMRQLKLYIEYYNENSEGILLYDKCHPSIKHTIHEYFESQHMHCFNYSAVTKKFNNYTVDVIRGDGELVSVGDLWCVRCGDDFVKQMDDGTRKVLTIDEWQSLQSEMISVSDTNLDGTGYVCASCAENHNWGEERKVS